MLQLKKDRELESRDATARSFAAFRKLKAPPGALSSSPPPHGNWPSWASRAPTPDPRGEERGVKEAIIASVRRQVRRGRTPSRESGKRCASADPGIPAPATPGPEALEPLPGPSGAVQILPVLSPARGGQTPPAPAGDQHRTPLRAATPGQQSRHPTGAAAVGAAAVGAPKSSVSAKDLPYTPALLLAVDSVVRCGMAAVRTRHPGLHGHGPEFGEARPAPLSPDLRCAGGVKAEAVAWDAEAPGTSPVGALLEHPARRAVDGFDEQAMDAAVRLALRDSGLDDPEAPAGLAEEAAWLAARANVARQTLDRFADGFKGYAPIVRRCAAELETFAVSIAQLCRRNATAAHSALESARGEARDARAVAERCRKASVVAQQQQSEAEDGRADLRAEAAAAREQVHLMEHGLRHAEKAREESEAATAVITRKYMAMERRLRELEGMASGKDSAADCRERELRLRQDTIDGLHAANEHLAAKVAATERRVVALGTPRHGGGLSRSVSPRHMQHGLDGQLSLPAVAVTDATAHPTGLAPALAHDVEGCHAVSALWQVRCAAEAERGDLLLQATKAALSSGELTPRPAFTVRAEPVEDHSGSDDPEGGPVAPVPRPQRRSLSHAPVPTTAAVMLELRHRSATLALRVSVLEAELATIKEQHALATRGADRFLAASALTSAEGRPLRVTPEDVALTPRWFVALGDGRSVPAHLRTEGRVRNRRLSKELTLQHAATFLHSLDRRQVRHSPSGPGQSMATLFSAWALEAFGAEDAISMTYSIHDACHVYVGEALCCYLLELLENKAGIAVWWTTDAVLDSFKVALKAELPQGEIAVPMAAAADVVRSLFHVLDAYTVDSIVVALGRDHPKGYVTIAQLYAHGSRLVECHFAAAVREALLRDRWRLLLEVEGALCDNSTTAGGTMTPYALYGALSKVDSDRGDEPMLAALVGVFGMALRDFLNAEDGGMGRPLKDALFSAPLQCPLRDGIRLLRWFPLPRFTSKVRVFLEAAARAKVPTRKRLSAAPDQ